MMMARYRFRAGQLEANGKVTSPVEDTSFDADGDSDAITKAKNIQANRPIGPGHYIWLTGEEDRFIWSMQYP
jgi:hypothetical protein